MTVAVTARPRLQRPVSLRIATDVLANLSLPVLLLVIWTVWSNVQPSRFFPAPWAIAEAFVDTWMGPAMLADVLPSVTRLLLAILIAIVAGIALGTLIGLVRWLRELTEPTLEFLRAIPPPVMIPVFVAVLGVTPQMQIIVIVFGAMWPVLLNTTDGVRSTDVVMIETARSYSIGAARRIFALVLPAASPRIMAGVRLSLSIALIMMVISELFASSSGLGYQIKYFQTNYLIAEMWSGVLLLGLFGIILSAAFGAIERRVLRWYHGVKEAAHD